MDRCGRFAADDFQGRQSPLVHCFTLAGTNKKRDFWFWQGANRSDTGWYREDLQHRQGRKDAFLCAR
jgi:hypothetical protein